MRTSHRRAVAAIGAGAVAVSLLAGCSPAASGGGGGGNVDLTVSVWGDAVRADLYQEVLDDFTADKEGVTATMEFAERAAFFERLTTAAASKNLPDVFWLTDTYFGRYASSGALLDFTPYLGEQIDTDAIGENWLSYGEFDGGVYGIPSHFNGQAVLTDQRVFDEAGIEYDATDWDEMIEIARELTRPDENFWGLADPTLGVVQRAFEAWVRQHGEEQFTEDGELGFSQEVLVDWWTMWADLREDGVVPPPDVQLESESQGVTTDLFVSDQIAIRLSSATFLSAIGVLRDGGLSIHDYPEIDGAADDWRMYTALMLVAAANTPDPELAAELVNTLVNDEEAAATTKISMGTPTPANVAESILPLLDEADQGVVSFLSAQQEIPSRPAPLLPETSEQFTGALARFGQEIAYGRMSPEEAADALFADAERYL
jgi:multiple sugar transport system substrate-binding protein